MSDDNKGNLRFKDEVTGVWLKEVFRNISASHNGTGVNVHYRATIEVPYGTFHLKKNLWETLKKIETNKHTLFMVGQFSYSNEPYIMKVSHLLIKDMVVSRSGYGGEHTVIRLKIEGLPESCLQEIKGKTLNDMRFGEPFVFR